MVLHNLHLPAVLAKPVLASAMQDFVDGVNPTDGNDWLTLAGRAQTIGPERSKTTSRQRRPMVRCCRICPTGTMRTQRRCSAGLSVCLAVCAPRRRRAAQDAAGAGAPALEILSPDRRRLHQRRDDASRRPDAAGRRKRLLFFVDGRQVCEALTAPFECAWEAGSNVVAHQIRAVAELIDGGRIVRTVRTKALGYAEKVDVDVVQVTATVTDGDGQFVGGLPRSAFRVDEDGKPQKITHFASEDVPLELIVAVDVSGSMTPAMPRLKTAVKEFLGAVPDRDQVTLLGFNDSMFALTRRDDGSGRAHARPSTGWRHGARRRCTT